MKLFIAAGVYAINMLSCSAHPDVFAMPASLAGMNYKMMAKRDDSSDSYQLCDPKKAPAGCEAVKCDAGYTAVCDAAAGFCGCIVRYNTLLQDGITMMLTVLCLTRLASLAPTALPTAWANSIHSDAFQALTLYAGQAKTAFARYVLVAS
jgi:hypothetical protein